MTKFEHKAVPVSGLPEVGKDGWRLVCVADGTAYLERELIPPPLPEPELPKVEEMVICLNCTHFSAGQMNQKTNVLGGFCRKSQMSTNHQSTCEKFESKRA